MRKFYIINFRFVDIEPELIPSAVLALTDICKAHLYDCITLTGEELRGSFLNKVANVMLPPHFRMYDSTLDIMQQSMVLSHVQDAVSSFPLDNHTAYEISTRMEYDSFVIEYEVLNI